MRFILVSLVLLAASSAYAQQQPNVSELQMIIEILKLQRNQAMDAHASAEVRAAQLSMEIEKLKKQSEEKK